MVRNTFERLSPTVSQATCEEPWTQKFRFQGRRGAVDPEGKEEVFGVLGRGERPTRLTCKMECLPDSMAIYLNII